MKVIYNRQKHTDELYDVTLVCSPLEALTIMRLLRIGVDSPNTHEKDRPIMKQMWRDMRGEEDGEITLNRCICRHFYRLCEYADRLGNCNSETYRCIKGYDRKVYANWKLKQEAPNGRSDMRGEEK